jgi:hypothetical protein
MYSGSKINAKLHYFFWNSYNFFKNTNIMNVSINAQSRVLFGVEGTYFASVDSSGITTDTIECVNDCSLGTSSGGQPYRISSILSNIQDKTRNLPINAATASPSNIADNAVTLNKIATTSLPLTTSRGGTGLSIIEQGRILVGLGVDGQGQSLSLATSTNIKVDNSNSILEIKGDLVIGGNKIGIRNDIFGRPTLSCISNFSNIDFNIMAPGLNRPKCSLSVAYSGTSIVIKVIKISGFPVNAFVVATRSITPLTKYSITNHLRAKDIDYSSSNVKFRGNDVSVSFNPVVASIYSINALICDARGTLSEIVSEVISSSPASLKIDQHTVLNNGRISFNRSSVATFVNSSGLIDTVQNDVMRLDHDPITFEPIGLLIEEARTNLVTQSVNLTTWLGQNRTVSISTSFPLFVNGDVFEITGTGNGTNTPSIARNMVSTSTTKCLSVFLRRGTNNFAQLYGVGDPTFFVNYDLLAGTVGTSGSATSPVIKPWGNGWFRCTVVTSAPLIAFGVGIVPSSSTARLAPNTLTTSIFCAAPQVEEGTFATSYIPTITASVTRAGDFASISGSNFSSWYNPSSGTFGVQFKSIFVTDSVIRRVLSGNDDNSIIHLNENTGRVTSYPGTGSSLYSGTPTNGNISKVYVSYSGNSMSLSVNGNNAVNLTTSSIASSYGVMNTLHIGYLGRDRIPFCGWVKSLVYYPVRLSISDMKIISN